MIRQNSQMTPAFSMLTAIFLIVLMSSVAAFIMNLSGKMIQETTLSYQKEQAALYAKSYTEFAILAATSQNCIQNINANIGNPAIGNGYNIVVNTQYIGNNLNGQPRCNTIDAANVITAASIGGSVIIDTYVRYIDPNHPNTAAIPAPWITHHRRTLQRL